MKKQKVLLWKSYGEYDIFSLELKNKTLVANIVHQVIEDFEWVSRWDSEAYQQVQGLSDVVAEGVVSGEDVIERLSCFVNDWNRNLDDYETFEVKTLTENF